MSADRPQGPTSPRTPFTEGGKVGREERQKIERVREIDPDEQARNRRDKFQRAMGEEAPAPSGLSSSGSKTPSPFEASFHQGGKDPLPHSDKFWKESDLPPDQPLPKKKFVEENPLQKKGMVKGEPGIGIPSAELPGLKEGEEVFIPLALNEPPPKKAIEASPDPKLLEEMPAAKKRRGKKGEAPMSGLAAPDPERRQESRTLSKEKKKEEKGDQLSMAQGDLLSGLSAYGEEDEEGVGSVSRQTPEGKMEEKRKGEAFRQAMRELPPLPQIAPEVAPLAQAALVQGAPLLRPEAIPLFFQMVGTLYHATLSSGVSITEVTLDQPAFASSPFFGMTIAVEKYATAPDSFNIRIIGENASAVQTVQRNIPSLLAAFEEGKFAFRVNRIQAEYRTEKSEKYLFRRKERGESPSEGGEEPS